MRNFIVYTGGTFDILHTGHINLLKACSKIAGSNGRVVVGLNTDDFIERYKGKLPYQSYMDRKNVLESCKYVSEVVPNEGGEDSTIVIEKVCPAFVVIGSDWAAKDYYKQMNFTQRWLDEKRILLVYVPYTAGISSTQIKEKLVSSTYNTAKEKS